jgi:ComEC/Rec2-related protein
MNSLSAPGDKYIARQSGWKTFTGELRKLLRAPRQPFVGLALAAGIGIVIADYFPAPRSAFLWLLIGVILLAVFLFVRPGARSTYAFVALAFFVLHTVQTRDTTGLRLAAELGTAPRVINATGSVVTEPKTGASGFSTFLLKLSAIEVEETHLATNATLFARWRGKVAFGDEVQLFGVAQPTAGPRNPGEFDMRAYLARADVRHAIFVRYAEDGRVVRRDGGNPILHAAQKSRAWMQAALCRSLDDAPDVQNFLSGIVLGLRHQTPEDIEEPFQQTGTLHLFAVAGLHVGIIARLLWILASVAQLRRKWASALIIPLLLFYAAITGLHVSSVRAAIMSSVLLAGAFFERPVFALNSLATAAFLLLSWNTNELFATGFQLSFAVVGAIIIFADPLSKALRPLVSHDPFLPASLLSAARRAWHATLIGVSRAGAVSTAAWVGSLVLIAIYFYLIAPVSLIANLVVVPIAFFVLAVAMLSLVTAPLLPSLSIIFNHANLVLARFVIAIVHFFAQLPIGHYYLAHPHWPDRSRAKIDILDLGAGAAVHIASAGHHWLFDCGSDRDYERILRPYLHATGVNKIEGLVLTHGDASHIGGALQLLREMPPTILIDNPAPDRSPIHRDLRGAIIHTRLSLTNGGAGQFLWMCDGVAAKILYPPREIAARAADDAAFVVQLVTPSARVLLTSDAGEATERALLNADVDLASDIIVKGQSHSSPSCTEAFLDAVQPQLIVTTSRDFPRTERVDEQWAERVRARGIKLFRQDESGAVRLRFWPNKWEARAYSTGETFRSTSR